VVLTDDMPELDELSETSEWLVKPLENLAEVDDCVEYEDIVAQADRWEVGVRNLQR
jgi:hypothetical protein